MMICVLFHSFISSEFIWQPLNETVPKILPLALIGCYKMIDAYLAER